MRSDKEETVLTDNEVIAKFMGVPKLIGHNGETLWDTTGSNKLIYALKEHNLHYRTSWDWIMPVVERINSIAKTTVSIYPKHCIISVNGTAQAGAHDFNSNERSETPVDGALIKIIYVSVVNFIKWHNENTKV